MSTAIKTAKFLRTLNGYNGEARAYELSEPHGYDGSTGIEEPDLETSLVVVSAVTTERHPAADFMIAMARLAGAPTAVLEQMEYHGPETKIFPATAESLERDKPVRFFPMPGSVRELSFEGALAAAGYTVIS